MSLRFTLEQRVRINEQDEPAIYVGKMATVQRLEKDTKGDSVCIVKVDWENEPLSLPERYLEPVSVRPSSLP